MIEELHKLRDSIAGIDLLNRPGSNTDLIEVLVMKKEPVQLRMEPDVNHKLPHIHLTLGKLRHHASYSVEDGSIIVGQSSRYDKAIKAWIADNRDKLLKLWKTIKAGEPYVIDVGELILS